MHEGRQTEVERIWLEQTNEGPDSNQWTSKGHKTIGKHLEAEYPSSRKLHDDHSGIFVCDSTAQRVYDQGLEGFWILKKLSEGVENGLPDISLLTSQGIFDAAGIQNKPRAAVDVTHFEAARAAPRS
jgi:hypothetical protein